MYLDRAREILVNRRSVVSLTLFITDRRTGKPVKMTDTTTTTTTTTITNNNNCKRCIKKSLWGNKEEDDKQQNTAPCKHVQGQVYKTVKYSFSSKAIFVDGISFRF